MLGIAGSVIVGFILVPLASQVLKFHQGYSLYNIGFTAGLTGMFFTAVLRGFGVEIKAVSILSNDRNTGLIVFLYALFALPFLLGFLSNRGRLTGFRCLLSQNKVLSLPELIPRAVQSTYGSEPVREEWPQCGHAARRMKHGTGSCGCDPISVFHRNGIMIFAAGFG